ncbi:MAG: hypothetical protein ABSG32_10485 [Terriglobia bacterium]|jgi:hypothetical protein
MLIIGGFVDPRPGTFDRVIFASSTVLLSLGFHWTAAGYAEESGLTVTRYFKQHFIPCDHIRNATWGGWDFAKLVVTTEHSIEGSTRLDFAYWGGSWQAFRRTWIPENVKWVVDHVNAHRQIVKAVKPAG